MSKRQYLIWFSNVTHGRWELCSFSVDDEAEDEKWFVGWGLEGFWGGGVGMYGKYSWVLMRLESRKKKRENETVG